MKKLTGIIITKNEEVRIADCIDSLSFCDEVIIVDSNSQDRTAEIAKHLGGKVFSVDDDIFSQANRRNVGLEKVKTKWILYIDADERVTPDLRKSIEEVVANKDVLYQGYLVQRQDFIFGNHKWPRVEKMERLFLKEALVEWYGDLHESPKVIGQIGELDGILNHYTHRDLFSMLEKTIAWAEIEANLRLATNHPKMAWWRFPRVMLKAFYESYIKQKGYKIGFVGL